jgi:hypothetical protein
MNALKEDDGIQPTQPHYGKSPLRLIYDRTKGGGPPSGPANPNNTIHNEKAKYLATWFNTIGSACVTIGVITPCAAMIFGYPNLSGSAWKLAGGMLVLFLVGGMLHFCARKALERIRP